MATSGRTEEIHMLEDFVCQAIIPPGVPRGNAASPGRNDELAAAREFVVGAGRPAEDLAIARVAMSVGRMPQDYRVLVALRLSGLPVPEIAERLGTSPAVIAERLDRIVSALQQ